MFSSGFPRHWPITKAACDAICAFMLRESHPPMRGQLNPMRSASRRNWGDRRNTYTD